MYEKCPVCGLEVLKGSKSCPSCRTVLLDESKSKKKSYSLPIDEANLNLKECIECFQKIDARAFRCNHCGTSQLVVEDSGMMVAASGLVSWVFYTVVIILVGYFIYVTYIIEWFK